MYRCRVLAFLASIALGAPILLVTARPSAGAIGDPQTIGSRVQTDEVCFIVHNEGDPVASRVYGVRYYVAEPGPLAKVILLVHGGSVTHAFWDVRPDFSVARRLAEAGYLVIAYDRLGYGKSPYMRPRGSGYTLTSSSQRAMLHEIVTQVKAGSYTSSRGGSCSDPVGAAAGPASHTVILIGHSAGAFIVSGYPGTYHDVAAMVQAGWSNQGFSPAGAAYLITTPLPQLAAGSDYANFFPTPQDCQTALIYIPGVVPSLVPELCRSTVPTPVGELTGAERTLAENLVAVQRVGPGLPVLLAWEDQDFFFPEDRQTAETQYWITHCGCDVESWTESATGHAFNAHLSMPTFISKVVAWLGSKGLGAK